MKKITNGHVTTVQLPSNRAYIAPLNSDTLTPEEKRQRFLNSITPIREYMMFSTVRSRGIGYQGGTLIEFDIDSRGDAICKQISLAQSVDWMREMNIAERMVEDFIGQRQWPDEGYETWLNNLATAVRK